MSVQRYAPFGGLQSSFHHLLSPRTMLPCSFASGCRITYLHHEESPDLEGGHGEAHAVAAGHATNKGRVVTIPPWSAISLRKYIFMCELTLISYLFLPEIPANEPKTPKILPIQREKAVFWHIRWDFRPKRGT